MLLSRGFPYELGFIILCIFILLLIFNLAEYYWRLSRNRKQLLSEEENLETASAKVKAELPEVETIIHEIDAPKNKFHPKILLNNLKSLLLKFIKAPFKIAGKIYTIFRNHWLKRRKLYFFALNIICVASITYWSYDLFIHPLGVNYDTPIKDEIWLDASKPIAIQFDRGFRADKLQPQISPEIKGEWKFEHLGIPFLPRRVVFYPAESVLPGERVIVYLSNVSNLIEVSANTWDKVNEFYAPKVPEIVSTVPTADSPSASTVGPIEINLDNPDGLFVDWDFKIDPEVSFEVIRNQSKQILLTLPTPLAQNTKYTLTISRRIQAYQPQTEEILLQDDFQEIKKFSFTTVRAPALSGSEPTGDKVKVDSPIKLKFDKAMDKKSVEANLKTEPEFAHKLQWNSDTELQIIPEQVLTKDTNYKFTLPKGIKSADGGVIEAEVVHSFKTLGPVKVNSTTPRNGSSSVSATTKIRIDFDQEVDHASAQAQFKTSPSISGGFSWDNNTMIFSASSALEYSKKYTVTISKGVKSIHGLDGKDHYNFSFTTRPQQIALNVPLTIQPYRYACNLTAAKMALAYRGVNFSVDSLYSQVAKDNTPYDSASNTWGNPNAGYVGDITGGNRGYGVHWSPVASLIGKYRGTSVRSGWNMTELLKEVEAGNPVIIWAHNGYAGSGTNTTWNLPGGGSVYTVRGMHSYVIRGFVGSPESPSTIMVNDPNRGRWNMSPSYFNSLWGTFNRTAIVVR